MKKKLSIIVIVLGLGAVLYMVFGLGGKSDPNVSGTLSSTSTTSNTAEDNSSSSDVTSQINQQFVESLSGIKGVNLDKTIFSSKEFNSLVDYTSSLVPEPNRGRPNPFAPIGSDVVSTLDAPTPASDVNTNTQTDLNTQTQQTIKKDQQKQGAPKQ